MSLKKSTKWVLGIGVLSLALFDPMTLPTPFHVLRPRTYGVTFEHLRFSHLALFALAYLVTSLFGLSLSWNVLREIRISLWVKLVGAFVVGYTASLAFIRGVSFFLRGGAVYWLTVACLGGLSLIFMWSDLKRLKKLRLPPVSWAPTCAMLGLLFFFLVLQVYQGDFRWVGHGPDQYSFFLQVLRGRGPDAPFPLITLHHDELLYTYFLTCLTDLRFDPILPMWITLAVTKVSAIALIYCAFLWVGTSRGFSLLGTLFISFGALGLNPLKYLTYFSANNPLAFVAHSGRVIGIPLAVIVLSSFIRLSNLPLRLYFFTGIGIALSYPSNAVSILIVMFGALIFQVLRPEKHRPPEWLETALFCSALLVPGLTYQAAGIPYQAPGVSWTSDVPRLFKWPIPPGCLFAILFALFTLFLAAHLRRFQWSLLPKLSPGFARGGIFLGMFALGALFFGGMSVDNRLARWVLSFVHQHDWLQALQIEFPTGFRLVPMKPLRFFVDAREAPVWNQYNWGLPYFFAAYGGLFFLAGTSLRTVRRFTKEPARWMGSLQLFLVGYLALVFFFIDFVDNIVRSWAKSCFLEIPVYCIIFLSFYLIDRFADQNQRRYVSGYALAYCLLPFLFTGRLVQCAMNLWTLIHLPR